MNGKSEGTKKLKRVKNSVNVIVENAAKDMEDGGNVNTVCTKKGEKLYTKLQVHLKIFK